MKITNSFQQQTLPTNALQKYNIQLNELNKPFLNQPQVRSINSLDLIIATANRGTNINTSA